ncbi:MAG: CPBP family intramembrane metalloprotease, partial [Candidatus Aminicenantes bacterium]
SLLFFGIPGLLIFLGVYWLVPFLVNQGIPLISAYFLVIWGPIIVLFIIILRRWLHSSKAGKKKTFKEYFNLRTLRGKAWLWVIAGLLAAQVLEVLLSPSSKILARLLLFNPPEVLPEIFSPFFDPSAGLTRFMGVPVKGNWWLILFWCLWLIVNIGGEELLWRGYALPRQKKVFGKWAWLVNGLMWNLFIHFFMRWTFIALLPTTLIVPYLCQKLDSTWPGIIIHGTGNLLVFIILVPAVIS